MDSGEGKQSEERLKQALLAHVREEFSAPITAIVGYSEILHEDASRHGLSHLTPDLGKVHEAGLALQRLVDSLLDPETLHSRTGDADYEAFRSRLRHDLRTPINAIKGYGEMLLEDANEARAEAFVRDLDKMLAAAKHLLSRIDSLVDFSADDVAAVAAGPAAVIRGLIGAMPVVEEPSNSKLTLPARILVVDDHLSNRDLLARPLARAGHEVVGAERGDEALRLIERSYFDLVLLDLLMPGMSGYEVLCRLKSDPRHRDIPVIMISALDEIDSIVRCIEAGAEDYMPKPFDPVLLRARINSCLERKRLRDREQVILQELKVEKAKTDALLHNILPKPIVSRLQQGETVIADRVSDATILFADLVGFTNLSARLSPPDLILLLNTLFTDFDRLSVEFGLEKIKTIGDAYMVVGGLLDSRGDHVEAVADMALAMLESVREAGHRLDEKLQIRVGMHTGPVVAGIIGTHKFIYDIWGDTVNTASRLESHGAADRISVSAETYRRLQEVYAFEPCGVVMLKGKGPTETYFLQGKRAAAG
jgi:class 3 adenylate cyclase/CheY-like chemotaxis protein